MQERDVAPQSSDQEPSDEEKQYAKRNRLNSGKPWADLSDTDTEKLRERFLQTGAHLEAFRTSLRGFSSAEVSDRDRNRMLDLIDDLIQEFDVLRPGSSHIAGFKYEK